jgi:hypothetical protein
VSGGSSEPPIDPEAAVKALIARLDQSHASVIPSGPIPPADDDLLDAARTEARAAADAAGRGEALTRAERTMAEWTMERYRRGGFAAAYFTGWQDTPERRLEVVDVMVDAAIAAALADLLPEDTLAALTARLDELQGGGADG